MSAVYINPYTDFGFKRLFGSEASKPFLMDFLNSILPPHHQIAELAFKNTEQLGLTQNDRKAIYDIYCHSITGEQFIVELQRIKQEFFKDRTLYYATFPITEQAKKGKNWEYQLSAVYCISILDFYLDIISSDVIHTIQLKNQHNQVFYDKLTFIYLEMPSFNKTQNELTTHLDKWLFYLKNLKDLQMIPNVFKNDTLFQQAFEQAKIANMNREEWARYEHSLKTYRDNMATDAYLAKVSWQEGRDVGLKQGMEKGIKKGMEKGIEKGIEQATLTTAKNLKTLGLSTDVIIQATGLNEETINQL